MIRIRRLTCFDYPKLKQLISYLCNDDNDKLAKNLMSQPFVFLNALLPLSLKFSSESYILTEGKEILGLITISCTPGNPYKININRLIFKENMYEVGKNLVNFVVQKMGAKGATTFTVTIDQCHEELFDLFINGCGFRQCSSETLWKIDRPEPQKAKTSWEIAQNSDAKRISYLYNSEIIPMYKPALERNPKEFQNPLFAGFTQYYKTRFIFTETKNILGYCSITTEDNINYILDMTLNNAYNINYEDTINFMFCEIARKKKAFYPIIKQKKYMKDTEALEEYLKSKNYIPIQTQQILVKNFYKQVPVQTEDWKVFVLGENQITEG